MDVAEQIDGWKRLKILGQGGFGCVYLWQNEVTKNFITIKECRFKGDMKEKMWERWNAEVSIINKLRHDNVIAGAELPPALAPPRGHPPVLAMEFCEGGDLRKVLNRPESCQGLEEAVVRQLVAGVGSALEYLHANRIIHRDLKPENIVLKHVDEFTVLYKIIDLGYAKEMDMTSVCNSFVGTVQYLAPELYVTKPYSKTVDYWSFGSLVYECITGHRPFLPTSPPVEWHEYVHKKSPDDISARLDENKKINFSKELPRGIHLCKPLKTYFEQWLALMLRWDAKARGGGGVEVDGVERPKCFYLLEKFLDLKILHLLHVEANRVLSYAVNETHTVADVHSAIEKETGLPRRDQEVVLANGIRLEAADLALHGYMESNNDELILFLFRKGSASLDSFEKSKFPPRVHAIVKEPHTLLPRQEHKAAWAEAVYWCCQQKKQYKRLTLSHRAALLRLHRTNSEISKLKSKLTTDVGNLLACTEQFKSSLDYDQQEIQSLLKEDRAGGVSAIAAGWGQMGQHVDAFSSLHDNVKNLEGRVSVLMRDMQEIQKNPLSKPKQTNELECFEQKSKELYKELKNSLSDREAAEIRDHQQMMDVVGTCYMRREELTKALFAHLSKIAECQLEMETVLPEVRQACQDVAARRQQLSLMQTNRQADLWSLIRTSICHTGSNMASDRNPMLNGGHGGLGGQLGSLSPPPTLPSASLGPPLQSLRLVDDCRSNFQKLQDMIHGMKRDQTDGIQYISSLECENSKDS